MKLTKKERIIMLEARITKMEQNPVNLLKSPGVLNRLRHDLEQLKNDR